MTDKIEIDREDAERLLAMARMKLVSEYMKQGPFDEPSEDILAYRTVEALLAQPARPSAAELLVWATTKEDMDLRRSGISDDDFEFTFWDDRKSVYVFFHGPDPLAALRAAFDAENEEKSK